MDLDLNGIPATKQEIKIDEEFKGLIPRLADEEYKQLKSNIVTEGKCRDPLVLWNGTIIDGHNRYEICMENHIPFKRIEMEFESREEAILWIIKNQLGRRNLKPELVAYFRGKQYEVEKNLTTNLEGKNQYSEVEAHSDTQPPPQTTAEKIGDRYGVSPATVKRDAVLAKAIDAIGEVSEAAKRNILSGETKIDRKDFSQILELDANDLQDIANQIESGDKVKIPQKVSESKKNSKAKSNIGDVRVKKFSALKKTLDIIENETDIIEDAATRKAIFAEIRCCKISLNNIQNKITPPATITKTREPAVAVEDEFKSEAEVIAVIENENISENHPVVPAAVYNAANNSYGDVLQELF
jgi:hypothetical protein